MNETTRNYYLWKTKDGLVIVHTDLQAAKDMDGLENPDLTATQAEWDECGGNYHISGGKIVLGKDPAEVAEEQANHRKYEIMQALDNLDKKSTRPLRAILTNVGTDDDKEILAGYEQQAAALREELASL